MTLFCLWLACANTSEKGTDSSSSDTAAFPDTTVDCDASWDAWASGFFTSYCQSCHSQTSDTRHGAPAGIDFDNREDAVTWSERVRIRVIADQTMPLGGGVTSDEIERLDTWLLCLEAQP